jgi:hypothetical protein
MIATSTGTPALANGGPFVVNYPGGDPAAKGVLARLDPDLKPRRETRLRVVKEDLVVSFGDETPAFRGRRPFARVSAAYTIENPTDAEIQVDFGFPILRGLYISPFAMMPTPHVQVSVATVAGPPASSSVTGDTVVGPGGQRYTIQKSPDIISNSAIYGIIRQRAREEVERGIADDAELARLVSAVRTATPEGRPAARQPLAQFLARKGWDPRDAALMVEYAGLNLAEVRFAPMFDFPPPRDEMYTLSNGNMGPLRAIGEQKATQFLAQLAVRFHPEARTGYEAIFSAWGGDVRERSVDLTTGAVRPREFTVDPALIASTEGRPWRAETAEQTITLADPTVYARVDYLDTNVTLSEEEKASCQAILKNLPVVFTFAPMNLLHYQVTFPAKSTQLLTVAYGQYPYLDTGTPKSYQLAYVVHPASLWDHFGPINLQVQVPKGTAFKASIPCRRITPEDAEIPVAPMPDPAKSDVYRAAITEKTGELFLAVGTDEWKAAETPKPPGG